MAKHTPGPWTNKTEVRVSIGEAPQFVVCGSHDRDTGVELANARLIAAAPELLEALQDIEQAWREDSPTFSATVERGRAAIAKATGE